MDFCLNLFDQNWVIWRTTRETGKVCIRKEHARGKVGCRSFSPGTGVECGPIVNLNYWGSASKEDSGGGRGRDSSDHHLRSVTLGKFISILASVSSVVKLK